MTNLDENLDDVFKAEPEEKVTEVTETKEESKSETKEDETKGEAKAETEGSETKETEPPSDKDEKLVPIVALHDERRKAKALKEELAQYKAKYDPDEDAPDPAEDPEGYKAHVRSKLTTEMHQEKIETSMAKMIETHPDYREKEKTFMFLSAHDESLVKEMNEAPDPARFAYEKATAYIKEQRDLIAAEIEASAKTDVIEDEKEPSESEKRNTSALSTPNLTTATAAGSNSDPDVTDNSNDLLSVFDE